MITPSQSK